MTLIQLIKACIVFIWGLFVFFVVLSSLIVPIGAFWKEIRKYSSVKDALHHIQKKFSFTFKTAVVAVWIGGLYLLFVVLFAGASLFCFRDSIDLFKRIPVYWEGKRFLGETSFSGKIYICTGNQAVCYHYFEDCRGLTNCSDMVVGVELDKAEEHGYEPCPICYMLDSKYY